MVKFTTDWHKKSKIESKTHKTYTAIILILLLFFAFIGNRIKNYHIFLAFLLTEIKK